MASVTFGFSSQENSLYTFRKWQKNGTWDTILELLKEMVRIKKGRNSAPSYGLLDFQSVKSSSSGEERGYDGNEKIKGRK